MDSLGQFRWVYIPIHTSYYGTYKAIIHVHPHLESTDEQKD